jgi:hypothetical protein
MQITSEQTPNPSGREAEMNAENKTQKRRCRFGSLQMDIFPFVTTLNSASHTSKDL